MKQLGRGGSCYFQTRRQHQDLFNGGHGQVDIPPPLQPAGEEAIYS